MRSIAFADASKHFLGIFLQGESRSNPKKLSLFRIKTTRRDLQNGAQRNDRRHQFWPKNLLLGVVQEDNFL